MKRSLKTHSVCCPLCGADNIRHFATTREHEYEDTIDEEIIVVQCVNCTFIYLNPQPNLSELDRIYPSEYVCHMDSSMNQNASIGRTKSWLSNFLGPHRAIKSLLESMEAQIPVQRVLDIGCGNGDMLDIFKTERPEIETFGIDSSLNACNITTLKGHSVQNCQLEKAEYPANTFDIVYSSNVIEHIADPNILFRKTSKFLKPDGVFLCDTPNIDGVDARLFSRSGYWGGYHAPRHWTFFTPLTFRQMAENNGFEVISINYSAVPIFWMWTLHHLLLQMTGSRGLTDFIMPIKEKRNNQIWSFCLKGVFTLIDVFCIACSLPSSLMSIRMKKRFE